MCTRAVYATAEGPSPREGPVATSVLSRLRSHNFIFDFAIRTRNCCLASALAGPGRRSSSRDGDRDETAGTHATRYPVAPATLVAGTGRTPPNRNPKGRKTKDESTGRRNRTDRFGIRLVRCGSMSLTERPQHNRCTETGHTYSAHPPGRRTYGGPGPLEMDDRPTPGGALGARSEKRDRPRPGRSEISEISEISARSPGGVPTISAGGPCREGYRTSRLATFV